MSQPDVRDVIIVGSGPAGLTAAVYTARANLAPLVIEGEPSSTSDQPGGQLMLTTEVENFPGFPEGIMGPELMLRFREQALRFGADIRTEKVTRVDLSTRPFGVWVGSPEAPEPTYLARSLIISTGAQSLMLGLEDEGRLIGHGVSTCATCDGFFFRDHEIAVVGGGRLRCRGGPVPHQVRQQGHAPRAPGPAPGQQDHAGAGLRQREDRHPVEHGGHRIVGDTKLDHLEVEDVASGATSVLPVTGLFVAIGHKPNTDLVKGQLELEDNGYLVTGRWGGAATTNVEGVFACGDVQDHTYRQAITAAGSGCQAAIDAERWLDSTLIERTGPLGDCRPPGRCTTTHRTEDRCPPP